MPDIPVPNIWGVSGAPAGVDPSFSPSLEQAFLLKELEAQGTRWAWSRRAVCPCLSNNDQTTQPDPNCPLCLMLGIFWFGPDQSSPSDVPGVPSAPVAPLDLVQQALTAEDQSAVIRGATYGIKSTEQLLSIYGQWQVGDQFLTVHPLNRIGYYDRLIDLEGSKVYSELSDWDPTMGDSITTSYRPTGINLVRSLVAPLDPLVDYRLTEDGSLRWRPGQQPTDAVRLTVHYDYHPSWLVITEPHAIRQINTRLGLGGIAPVSPNARTPSGQTVPLPLNVHLRLEHVVRSQRVGGRVSG